jgi:hypothetical protein
MENCISAGKAEDLHSNEQCSLGHPVPNLRNEESILEDLSVQEDAKNVFFGCHFFYDATL